MPKPMHMDRIEAMFAEQLLSCRGLLHHLMSVSWHTSTLECKACGQAKADGML